MDKGQSPGLGIVVLLLTAAALLVGVAWRAAGSSDDSAAQVAGSGAEEGQAAASAEPSRTYVVEPGWRASQIVQALDEAGFADSERFLAIVLNPGESALLAAKWRALGSLEGYLAPGEYTVSSDATADDLLVAMTSRFDESLTPDMRRRGAELDLSIHDVVTLASIVEREMVRASEAPVIASVFHNRLRAGIRLESDPTVTYAVDNEFGAGNEGWWARELRRSDLLFESPYNTYWSWGLPPGPIASPSPEAITAVLYPASVDYLYFVAKGNGAHAFSKTKAEHEANVARYRDGQEPPVRSTSELQRVVERVMASVDGRIGVVVKNLATGEVVGLNERDFFSAASLYKLAVVLAAFEHEERGLLGFDWRLPISRDVALLDVAEVRARLGSSPTVREAIEEMIVVSSNAAGLALLNWLGRQEIDRILRANGLNDTSVSSQRLITTPNDIALLLERFATGQAVSREASSEIVEILLRQEIDDRLPKYLPKGVPLAHKTGTLDFRSHDAGILYSRHGPVVIVAMTEDVRNGAETTEAIAQLGRAVFDYFETYAPIAEGLAASGSQACAFSPFRPRAEGPLSGKTIVLDPGHGGSDSGDTVVLPDGFLLAERDIVLDVGLRLRDLLTARGATVHMTRCRDTVLSLKSRAALANAADADLVVSLHVHGAEQPGESGTEVRYFAPADSVSAKHLLGTYAEPAIWEILSASRPLANRGLVREWNDFLLFSLAPTVETISSLLSDPAEAEALRERASEAGSRRAQLADGHLQGILIHFGAGLASPPQPAHPSEPAMTTDVYGRLATAGPLVALTFDDCAEPGAWSRILAILKAEEVRATFFCIGTLAAAQPDLARRTVQEGHTVGSHGWDHAREPELSRSELRDRFSRDAAVWGPLAGVSSLPYFRPPFGAYDRRTLSEAARAGYSRTILWDIDSRDWTEPGAHTIVDRVVREARNGSIVLLHVLDQTADALAPIIRGLRARGLRPVSLPELFASATTAGSYPPAGQPFPL